MMVCGEDILPDDFSIPDIFHVLMDDECQQGGGPVVECLWAILDAWQVSKRIAFIKFLTGTNKLPLPGTEFLRLEMPFFPLTSQELKQQLGMLPQVGCITSHDSKTEFSPPNVHDWVSRMLCHLPLLAINKVHLFAVCRIVVFDAQ